MNGNVKCFGRNVWQLEDYALMADVPLLLSWNDFIQKGVGTRHQRHFLVSSSKQLFLALYGPENTKGRNFSPLFLLNKFRRLKSLARWMVGRGIWRFCDLTVDDVFEFLRDRKARRIGDSMSEKTISSWGYFFRSMWDVRGQYHHPICVDISRCENDLLAAVKFRLHLSWRAIEDDVAIGLIKSALDFIEEFGGTIIGYVSERWKISLLSTGKRRFQVRAISNRWYASVEQTDEYRRLADRIDYSGAAYKLLGIALSLLEGACAFLLLILVGMRSSELLALDANCLVEGKSRDGYATTYIRGVAAKNGARTRVWVAAEPVANIVRVLLKLTHPLRHSKNANHALFVQRAKGGPFFLAGRRQIRWSYTTLIGRLDLLTSSGLMKGAPKIPHFHPHMARKTFAQLAVRRDKSKLEPVAAQLGHAYSAFTDRHYVGRDHDLRKLLDEEDRKELAAGLEHLLTCGGLSGQAAVAIEQFKISHGPFRGRKSLRTAVDELIEKGVVLAPCDWGFCVYARVYSACGGDERGPNQVSRSPDVCAGCQNLLVTPLNRPWWEERVRREELFLQKGNLPVQTRAVVSDRLRKAMSVLAIITTNKDEGVVDESKKPRRRIR